MYIIYITKDGPSGPRRRAGAGRRGGWRGRACELGIHIYIYIYTCISFLPFSLSLSIYIYIYLYVNIYIYIYMYTSKMEYVVVCMYVYTCVCVYIYIYICIYVNNSNAKRNLTRSIEKGPLAWPGLDAPRCLYPGRMLGLRRLSLRV